MPRILLQARVGLIGEIAYLDGRGRYNAQKSGDA
jgi:hypothetical protein